jgi:hypothetical protein
MERIQKQNFPFSYQRPTISHPPTHKMTKKGKINSSLLSFSAGLAYCAYFFSPILCFLHFSFSSLSNDIIVSLLILHSLLRKIGQECVHNILFFYHHTLLWWLWLWCCYILKNTHCKQWRQVRWKKEEIEQQENFFLEECVVLTKCLRDSLLLSL